MKSDKKHAAQQQPLPATRHSSLVTALREEPVPLEVTDVLDLHSFVPKEIAALVETYLAEARGKGFASVRIIHGKGTGTQRAQVHSILRRTSFVASFQDAPMEAGGWGATVVWFETHAEKAL